MFQWTNLTQVLFYKSRNERSPKCDDNLRCELRFPVIGDGGANEEPVTLPETEETKETETQPQTEESSEASATSPAETESVPQTESTPPTEPPTEAPTEPRTEAPADTPPAV